MFPEDEVSHNQTEAFLKSQPQLGPAAKTLQVLLRFAFEQDEKAPHMFTTLWTLAALTGQSERTVQRHLCERGHTWSGTVKHFFDVRVCFSTCFDKFGHGETVISGLMIRFFPDGRYSKHANVKRYYQRDMALARAEGKTQFFKPEKARYARKRSPMSSSIPMRELINEVNGVLLFVKKQKAPLRTANTDNDIEAKLHDFRAKVRHVLVRGRRPGRVIASFVQECALVLATKTKDKGKFAIPFWRGLLWTCAKQEFLNQSPYAFRQLELLLKDISECQAHKNPVASSYKRFKLMFNSLKADVAALSFAGAV
jgi:hypothetical protein